MRIDSTYCCFTSCAVILPWHLLYVLPLLWQKLETTTKEIASQYLRGWFLIDVASSVP